MGKQVEFRHNVLNIMTLAFAACRFIHNFWVSTHLKIIQAALLLIGIIIWLPKVSRLTKFVLVMLFSIGAALLWTSGTGAGVWLDAVLQNGNVVLLLICGPMISAPFYYEDYQGALKTFVQVRMRSLLSFILLVTLCSHILTVVIAISAMLIVFELLNPFAKLYGAEIPFLKTATRGQASSGFWSPAWASVIVYTAYPDLKWVKVIPVGIAFAVLFNAMNILGIYVESKRHPGRYKDIHSEEGAEVNGKMLGMMLFLAAAMIGAIIIINLTTGWDLIMTVSLVAILFPVATALIQRHTNKLGRRVGIYYGVTLVRVREQVAIFTLAGFLGKALDVAGAGVFITGLLPEWLRAYPALMVCVIMLLMILPSFIGVHPAAAGTAIIVALPPAALGLTPYTYCLTILTGWLLTIMLSPFSAAALILSATTGKNIFELSIGLNWRFGAVCLVVFSLLIAIVGPIMG